MAETSPRRITRTANTSLASAWRAFGRIATVVAVITAPAVFFWLHRHEGISTAWSILFTVFICAAFRGIVDVLLRRFIPWPSLFGIDSAKLTEEDATNRRRAWFWRYWVKLALIVGGLFCLVTTVMFLAHTWTEDNPSWSHDAAHIAHAIGRAVSSSAFWIQILILPLFFVINFAILFGPLMMMGASQIRGFEPGDAKWGVKLEDVRGQAEAKEEIRRIVSLWESGEAFERAGGKRERGILFFGAPGTGKTMLAKAIATSFNCPIVTIPGSGFAQTFIGMDAVIVRWMARKAKKLARKWGGQCIVFIDEIDAVGMRRQALGQGAFWPPEPVSSEPRSIHDFLFFGPNGALNPTGDVILETREWRERLFATRAPAPRQVYPAWVQRLGGIVNQVPGGFFGGMTGGLALNQLLVVMDGIDNPGFFRRVFTNRINQILDVVYVVPRRFGKVPLRLPPARPAREQIYFIGATNVPLSSLDPALTRPGRMGRHVWFRTPTKDDRKDIFDLYLAKVAHNPELDRDERRDEIARITNGYSPAMIEQVCSMALTYAHHDGREFFEFSDLVEAMTTVESGSAIGAEYTPSDARAVAIHEAGHAIAAHVYLEGVESVRLSIRHRGGSLGHHQAMEKEERFGHAWRHEEVAKLIWGIGSMAAERVFFADTSNGVGGDLQQNTTMAAAMVGVWGMGPDPIELNGRFANDEEREAAREKVMKRFEKIGVQLMARASLGVATVNPLASVMNDRDKRSLAAQLLGQAYMAAHLVMEHNKGAVDRVANVLLEKKEIFGNELLDLLNSQKLEIPYVDLTKDEVWPIL